MVPRHPVAIVTDRPYAVPEHLAFPSIIEPMEPGDPPTYEAVSPVSIDELVDLIAEDLAAGNRVKITLGDEAEIAQPKVSKTLATAHEHGLRVVLVVKR